MNATKAERRAQLDRFEKTATRWAVGLIIAGVVLALVAIVLGSAEVFPYEYTTAVSLTAMLVPIGLALLIGAVGGLYVMGGPKVAPFGVVFVGGFAALVYGIAVTDLLWRDIGVGLLALSGAGLFVAGVVSKRLPPAVGALWVNGGALVGGAVLAVVGHVLGYWPLLLFGAMAFGCAAGGLLGRLLVRRTPS
ncbi:hypothetical protein [Actinophytocola sp. NPDC049390]|uniref:hypothetical protein n=1 Tax=Actinophytocola sp. NPDC049390 TaxID=3363894 RepID=UPI00379F85BB